MSTIPLASAQAPLILVVDIGTSSLRAVLFDAQAREVEGTRARQAYAARTSDQGASELDPDGMFSAFATALDELHAGVAGRVEIAGVASSSLASSVLAVDEQDRPLTPAFLYSDTRNAGAVEALRNYVDWTPIYARTGCPLHTSYLPARWWWLRGTQPQIFQRTTRWVSLHEFFLLKLFGRSIISHSLAAWTGLLNHTTLDWDDGLLNLLDVRREQLSPLARLKDCLTNLNEPYAMRWPMLARVRFFPAVGDGAAANIGSGCTDATRVAVTIGTSGAMRAVIPRTAARGIPHGLWLYLVDERRGLLGGSLNNGGNVFAYLTHTLQLPDPSDINRELSALEPDGHGLTILPFFAGERSPGYHGDARASVTGLTFSTTPVEIVRAALEAIAYRVALISECLREAIPPPREIIASGAALENSPVWNQILADVLGQAVIVSGEAEATARGAALLALEAVGAIRDAAELTSSFGATFSPEGAHHEKYLRGRERQKHLYELLIERQEMN